MARWQLRLGLGKIGAREKAWILIWTAILLGVGYVRFFYSPRSRSLREVRAQLESQEQRKISLLAKQPNVKRRQEGLEGLKKEITGIYERLVQQEEELLDVQDVDHLLDALVKDRRKFELVLNSIRPVQKQEPATVEATQPGPGGRQSPEMYKRLYVQLDLFGTFKGLVDFVDFLEKMGPYQEVQTVKVKVEGKEVTRPHGVLTVVVLMGDTLKEARAQREELFARLGEVAEKELKDPFLTGDRPKEMVQAVGMVLSGVFAEGGKPVAAMINNEIYRVGQMIQGKRIISIEANRVILEQGNRRFILVAGQEREGTQ